MLFEVGVIFLLALAVPTFIWVVASSYSESKRNSAFYDHLWRPEPQSEKNNSILIQEVQPDMSSAALEEGQEPVNSKYFLPNAVRRISDEFRLERVEKETLSTQEITRMSDEFLIERVEKATKYPGLRVVAEYLRRNPKGLNDDELARFEAVRLFCVHAINHIGRVPGPQYVNVLISAARQRQSIVDYRRLGTMLLKNLVKDDDYDRVVEFLLESFEPDKFSSLNTYIYETLQALLNELKSDHHLRPKVFSALNQEFRQNVDWYLDITRVNCLDEDSLLEYVKRKLEKESLTKADAYEIEQLPKEVQETCFLRMFDVDTSLVLQQRQTLEDWWRTPLPFLHSFDDYSRAWLDQLTDEELFHNLRTVEGLCRYLFGELGVEFDGRFRLENLPFDILSELLSGRFVGSKKAKIVDELLRRGDFRLWSMMKPYFDWDWISRLDVTRRGRLIEQIQASGKSDVQVWQDHFLEYLQDEQTEIVTRCAHMLGEIGNPSCIDALQKRAEGWFTETDIKHAVQSAVESIRERYEAQAGRITVIEDKDSEGQLSFNDQTKGRVTLAKKQKSS